MARACSPDVIIAPSCHDAHQDHRTVAEILPTVFRDALYLAYEIPKWDGDLGPALRLRPAVARRRPTARWSCCTSAFRHSKAGTGGTTRSSSAWPDYAAWNAGPPTPKPSPARRSFSPCHGSGEDTQVVWTLAASNRLKGQRMTVFVDLDASRARSSADPLRGEPGRPHPPAGGAAISSTTRETADRALQPLDPEYAHEHFDKEEMARMLGAWKPASFTRPGEHWCARSSRRPGFGAEDTHYDLPKPRTSFPVGHLTTGIAYAFPWHRDVWYSAPAQQINWWLPVFPVRA